MFQANLRGSETDSAEKKKKKSHGEKKSGVQIKGSTDFSSAPNTRETFGAHSHVVIARLSRLIVNNAAGCYFRRQALGLNTVIPTRFCAMFREF